MEGVRNAAYFMVRRALAGEESDCNRTGNPAGCSKRSSSKAAASEEARRYKPHFVRAVRPYNRYWRTEKPLQ